VGCHPADAQCALTSDGSPAWLLASIGVKTLASTGTAQIYLQIGANGMNYQADPLQVPAVTFGVNSATPAPTYDSGVVSQRSVSLFGDEPDAVINAVAALNGDFNGDAAVDAADYVVWRKGLGTTFMQSHYDLWRANFGRTAGSGAMLVGMQSTEVPEPASILAATTGLALFHATRITRRARRASPGR
jgi:hypothetical protein